MKRADPLFLNGVELTVWVFAPGVHIVNAADVLVGAGVDRKYATTMCTPAVSDYIFWFGSCRHGLFWREVGLFVTGLYCCGIITEEHCTKFKRGIDVIRAAVVSINTKKLA
jgi:hypothetical protein